jgi:hypothetical protein
MKRSSQVALLLMGVTGVGATTMAVNATRSNCSPGVAPPSATAPAVSGAPAGCATRTGYGGSGRWSRPMFASSSTTTTTTTAPSATTARGGFGSFGHMFSSGS